MRAIKSRRISFCNDKLFIMIALVLLLWVSITWAQTIQIIKTNELIAVINQGSRNDIQEGDYFVVKRLVNNSWRDMTYAEAVDVREDMTGIKVLDIAPQISLTTEDVVEKVLLESQSSPPSNSQPVQTANRYNAIQADSPSSVWQRDTRLVYLGPATGMFVPLGDVKDHFDTALCYGGMAGFRFRGDLDLSLQFLYATKYQTWTFWNVFMLGRRYVSQNVMLDFGYGVCYPENWLSQGGQSFDLGNLRMGVLFGAGYTFPIAFTSQFEIGFLFHVYPNMNHGSGEFLTIHGRFVL